MIAFEGLSKGFDGRPVLEGIDLGIREGEITFVIGASGTGKSVLMKHAVGLLVPDAGRVILDGEDTSPFPRIAGGRPGVATRWSSSTPTCSTA